MAMTLDIGLCVAFRANDVDAEHWFMPVLFLHVLKTGALTKSLCYIVVLNYKK